MVTSNECPVTGYGDKLTARPGQAVNFKVSGEHPGTHYRVDITRLRCVDRQQGGAGFKEVVVPSSVTGSYTADPQRVDRGSRAVIPAACLSKSVASVEIDVTLWPTAPGGREQAVIGNWHDGNQRGFALFLDSAGIPTVRLCGEQNTVIECSSGKPLKARQWVNLTVSYSAAQEIVEFVQTPLPDNPGEAVMSEVHTASHRVEAVTALSGSSNVTIAAWVRDNDARGSLYEAHYDGKIDSPSLSLDGTLWGSWDFSQAMDSRAILDASGNGHHGELFNLPTRAVTGCRWNRTEYQWQRAPDQYAAIHFHSDDLYDAGWSTSFTFIVPDDLASGIYSARLESEGTFEHIPFFVCPPKNCARAKLALLLPTASYQAYANLLDPHIIAKAAESGDFEDILARLNDDSEYGLSCYHNHNDGSGVHHSSLLRPILNLKPRDDLWAFNADTLLTDWLEASDIDYDIITDQLLHEEGAALLSQYQVVMTGTHPEYYSTNMLDGVKDFEAAGGRLMYMGANGFYWRIAFSDHWPAAIELRRTEDGTRAWESRPGEYYHAWGGELGGLWRRIGFAPNQLVGVGFTAQGFSHAIGYKRTPAADDPRAGFVFDSVDNDVIGDYGRLGGAAGEEIDRADTALGTPSHALVLATARGFEGAMAKTKEEYLAITPPDPADPAIRADMVFYETQNGGAVFSTGSIAWAGSLCHNHYDNDVSRITRNVVKRFLNPEKFAIPISE